MIPQIWVGLPICQIHFIIRYHYIVIIYLLIIIVFTVVDPDRNIYAYRCLIIPDYSFTGKTH